CKVLVLEGRDTIGGGTRSAEMTLPGFLHDICSAIHPLGAGSPFFRELPLDDFGLEWIHPTTPLAHPFDDGSAAVLERTFEATGQSLGEDADAYRRLMEPLVHDWEKLIQEFLGPLHLPRHPIAMARFGLWALWPAQLLARFRFRGKLARGLFAGLAAHAIQPLGRPPTAAFGLMLAMLGHAVGWPLPRGGAQSIAKGLACYLTSLGGEIVTGHFVESLAELPPSRVTLLDVAPRQLLRLAGERLPSLYRRQLERYRYGPGVFKLDLALAAPVPWRAEVCQGAGTVHVGGTLEEIAAAEQAVWDGKHPERPFVLVAQPSLFDPSRAPAGQQTLWAYCHVPNGSTTNMTEAILAQIERFAPGLRELILDKHTRSAADYECYNPNYVGGDINAGVQDLRQLYTRPAVRLNPYATPLPGLFLCSSATPPGGGVHGMCGYHAARAALEALER
ncbi:MAG: phytoene desaturase family protein, partial [Ardenticatenaceae bacterium]